MKKKGFISICLIMGILFLGLGIRLQSVLADEGVSLETEAESTEISTEMPGESNTETELDTEEPEREPVLRQEYDYINQELEQAITEKTTHDISIEAGDKKKVIITKDKSKDILVKELTLNDMDELISSTENTYKFSKFKVVSCKSSDTKVVKISKSESETYPVITAVAAGSATIEIVYSYSYQNLQAYYKTTAVINVKENTRNVGLYPVTMIRGEAVTYEPQLSEKTYTYVNEQGKEITETKLPESITWVSSDMEIASVSEGKVEGLLQGTVTITLKYKYMYSDGSLTCLDKVKVTVNCYTVEGEEVLVQESVAMDKDATPAINAACVYARDHGTDTNPYRVVLKEGTYKLASGSIRLFSNTILDLTDNVTICFAGIGGADNSARLLMLGTNGEYDGVSQYNKSDKCEGYGGFRNIQILGGIFQSTNINKATHIVMAHAQNILLKDVTLSGGVGMHMMEIAAIDGFTMENCVFKDFTGSKKITADSSTGRVAYAYQAGNYEALQFDVAASDECLGGIYMDGTPMKNVKISGCTFDQVPRGIGIHSQILGSYHDTVEITDNLFRKTVKEAILLLGFKNCKINHNVIEKCGAGITMQSISNNITYVMTKIFECTEDYDGEVEYDFNSEIRENTISIVNKGKAIQQAAIYIFGSNITAEKKTYRPANHKLWGIIPKDNYYIGNVAVEDNEITTEGWGIYFSDAKGCTAKGNVITGTNFPAKSVYNGIYVANGSSIDEITENTITNMQGNGISVSSLSNVTGDIVDNRIENVVYSAIKMENVNNPILIGNNILTTKSKTGNVINISTGKNNKNRVTIQGNKIQGITGNKATGVYVGSGVCSIKKNRFSNLEIAMLINKSGVKYKQSGNMFSKTVKKKKKTVKNAS